MTKYWNIEKLIKHLIKTGKKEWCDERCHLLSLDHFVIIFHAKYCPPNREFAFQLIEDNGRTYILASTISNFQYRFPVQ